MKPITDPEARLRQPPLEEEPLELDDIDESTEFMWRNASDDLAEDAGKPSLRVRKKGRRT